MRWIIDSRGADRAGQERSEVRIGARTVDQETDVDIAGGVDDARRCARIRGSSASVRVYTGALCDLGGDLVEHPPSSGQRDHVEAAVGQLIGEPGADAVGCAAATTAHGRTCPRMPSRPHSPPTVVTRDRGEPPAGDPPALRCPHDLVVVEADRVHPLRLSAAMISPSTAAARGGPVAVEVDGPVGDPVQVWPAAACASCMNSVTASTPCHWPISP